MNVSFYTNLSVGVLLILGHDVYQNLNKWFDQSWINYFLNVFQL